jgi:hypothetical protein
MIVKRNKYYFLSLYDDLDGTFIEPIKPKSEWSKHGIEDSKIPRIELYTNIDQALMSYYGQDLTGLTFTVYTTIGLSKESIIEPNITQTPLSPYTNPIWCISPLKLIKLTKIKVLGKDSYIDFKFGPRSLPGKIWKYKWVEWNGYEKPVLGNKKEDKHYYQTKEQNRKYQSIELLAKNNKGKTIEILKDTQPYCVIKVGIDGSYKIMKRL